MNAIVTVVLSLLETLLPLVTSSDQIAKVIATLIQIIPIITKEAQDLVQPVQNIIAALQANPAASDQQLADLAALDAKVDADFDAAAAAVEAEDAAPVATPAP
jgi:predicted PurR-regulated permease PerM